MGYKKRAKKNQRTQGWENLCGWYDGWMGQQGSKHHQNLAIPQTMALLAPQKGEQILDIGAGQGVLAPYVARSKAQYTGIDISAGMLRLARKRHGRSGRFIQADARSLQRTPGLFEAQFDGAVFLLSIQDMEPLSNVLASACWALKPGGRVVILMTHPCFRPPRQSGWGWDPQRKLQYRRIDRYLTPLNVPRKAYPGQDSGVNISFHRPLMDYVNQLDHNGLPVRRMVEITAGEPGTTKPGEPARQQAESEIPLFLGLLAGGP